MGKQMVEAFLLEQANVSYCARTVTGHEFDEFHQSLEPSNGARALGTSLDLNSKDALDSWVKKAGDTFGRIDAVVANGTSPPFHLAKRNVPAKGSL